MATNKRKVINILLPIPNEKGNIPELSKRLGSFGLDTKNINQTIVEQCKEYGLSFPARIHICIKVNEDKTYTVHVHRNHGASVMIRQALNLEKGSKEPGHKIIAEISEEQCRAIAIKKMIDMGMICDSEKLIQSATNSIMGTAKSMGISVIKQEKKNV